MGLDFRSGLVRKLFVWVDYCGFGFWRLSVLDVVALFWGFGVFSGFAGFVVCIA